LPHKTIFFYVVKNAYYIERDGIGQIKLSHDGYQDAYGDGTGLP